jgi:hypothetical protein
MANRRTRSRRRLVVLGVVVIALLVAGLLVGVVEAAHRAVSYRRSVDQSFAAEASSLLVSSNATGAELSKVLSSPGSLGRVLLESRLQSMAQQAAVDAQASEDLLSPPPDARAAVLLVDTLRLRDEAVATIRSTIEGLLVLAPVNPVGDDAPRPPLPRLFGLPGAKALLRHAGEQLVLADRDYAGLPTTFAGASGGAQLPASQWTQPSSGRLMPETLLDVATALTSDPVLAATVHLVIVAVETTPPLLPIGRGYPVAPTRSFSVAISVNNSGSTPALVTAIIRVRPLGRLGHFDSGRTAATVDAEGAVGLQLPTMAVVPGEHCLVTIELVRPPRQTGRAPLRWARDLVVGEE